LDEQYMAEQLRRASQPAPTAIGIDEIAIGKGHSYRIIVSDLNRGRPIWFGGQDPSEASVDQFFAWLGLLRAGALPAKAADDALHIAVAATRGVPFLLTWNCRHLANAAMRPVIEAVCKAKGYTAPIICTPEQRARKEERLEVCWGRSHQPAPNEALQPTGAVIAVAQGLAAPETAPAAER
jgi:hypothetical protein